MDTIEFDKDDDDTLDFVTAASNLRSVAYGIEEKTRWEVKGKFSAHHLIKSLNVSTEMAGNIIPAIATTNAIISGLIVLQALHLLRKSYDELRNVHLQFKPTVPLSTITLSTPNPACGICRDTYTEVLCDPVRTTLGDVVKGVLGDNDREVGVYEDKRVLADPDWDDNYDRTLDSLNVTGGKFLSIVDEDGELGTITVAIGGLPYVLFPSFVCQLSLLLYSSTHPASAPSFILPDPLPQPPRKEKPPVPAPETPPRASLKRSAPDDDVILLDDEKSSEPAAKKQKLSQPEPEISSPSKKRRLEEDGLIMMERADDYVIVID